MMKVTFVAAVLALAMATPLAAETLDNRTIVTLSAAGLGDEAIIAKIKSSTGAYDLSTDQIIALKQKGVSGPVIAAMLATTMPATGPATYSMTSLDPMVAHPAGVYLVGPTALTRIDATVSNQAKTGGLLGYAFTGGIASMSIKAAIPGDTARTAADSRRPSFLMFFDESNPESARQVATFASGESATVTSPAEFTLIQLSKKQGRREARVGSINIGGAKTGVMDRDQIPFDYQMVRPGVFKAVPKADIAPGEYGFIYAINGSGTRGAMTARIFDFSVH
jgi:hypothetical protein